MKNYNTPTGKKRGKNGQTGLYATLALSVAMLSLAGYFAYTQTKDSLEGQLDSSISIAESINSADNANANKSGVKKETTTTTTRVTTVTTKTTTTARPATTTTAAQPSRTENNSSQPIIYPINGNIINEFSNGELVKSTTTGIWQTHNGIDIEANEGDSVKSMTAGTVTKVDLDALWGYCVTVDHGNGITARYCNLNEGVSVTEGTPVNAGTVLGAVGKTADIESLTPSHLHFEVMQNDSYIDPCEFIEQ